MTLDLVRHPEQHTETDRRPGDDQRRAQLGFDHILERHAEEHRRQRAENHPPGQLAVAIMFAPQQTAEPGQGHIDHLVAEVEHHRRERTDMNRHVEDQALVRPAENPAAEDQVGRARDRQELGQALYQGKNDNLDQCHWRSARSAAEFRGSIS